MIVDDNMLARAALAVRRTSVATLSGRVLRVTGLSIEAHIPGARIGDVVEIEGRPGTRITAEVVGFRDDLATVIPLADVRGIEPGARVRRTAAGADMPVSDALLGRVVDPFGRPLDGGGPIRADQRVPLERAAPPVEDRARVDQRFETGVRVIDGLLTCGRGQRVGIFAGAGVGKTVLIRQITEQSQADITVIGLIGERGCEVQDLLSGGMTSSTVIVAATSDRSPMERARGAHAATAVAEHFRDRGASVLLVIDSLTRYAMALREIGLAASEPPATKGYPPSVFARLPRLLERVSPMAHGGSITGFYTVLVEGDDLADPVADAARSLLDGHIVLSRDLAARGHFPAIDVLASASRVLRAVTPPDILPLLSRARAVLARRKEAEELRSLGAYVPGANPAYDDALALGLRMDDWMRQDPRERSDHAATAQALAKILATSKVDHR